MKIAARAMTAAAAVLAGIGGLAGCDPAAVASFVVTTGFDAVDASVGDGVCATAGGACSLRAAVQEGNGFGATGVVEITFSGVASAVLNLPGLGEDGGLTGDLDLARPFRVIGTGTTSITNTTDRVFDVFPDASLVARNLRLDGGSASVDRGGVIRVQGASALELAGSSAEGIVGQDGGAIHSDGPVTLRSSTIYNSQAVNGTGGAVVATAVDISTSTLYANRSATAAAVVTTAPGAASQITSSFVVVSDDTNGGSAGPTIVNAGPLSVVDSTVAYNGSPVGSLGGGAVTVTNSVVAANDGPDCAAPVTSAGFNLESATSCGFTGGGDLQHGQFDFDPTFIAQVGNVIVFHALAGPAIDGGGGCLATDIVGRARPLDGDGSGTAQCDRGAYEHDPVSLALGVDSGADAVDVSIGDGVCETIIGSCSLRAAIQEANARGTADTIQIDFDVISEWTLAGDGENNAATGDLDIIGDLTIAGGSDDPVLIDANGFDRVFDVRGGTVVLERLHITGGLEDRGEGGAGIRATAGSNLTVSRSYLVDNDVLDGSGGSGGALRIAGSATIDASTIRSNDGGLRGGGIFVAGPVTIVNSTFDQNSADAGAAISVIGAGSLAVTSSTVVGKSATIRPIERVGSMSVRNSILLNTTGQMCNASLTTLGHNMESDTSCGLVGAGDAQSSDPLLLALADNGGSTLTRMPGVGSPAIGTGACVPSNDQRNIGRPQGGACDKGSVEQ